MNTEIITETITIGFHCDKLREIHQELWPTVETIVFSLGDVQEYTPAFQQNFLRIAFEAESYNDIGKAKLQGQLAGMVDTMLTASKLFPKESFND